MTSLEATWAACDYSPTAGRLAPMGDVVAKRVCTALRPGAHVVDVGTGHGYLARKLLDRGMRVTAIEPVERLREIGLREAPEAQWVGSTGEYTGLPPPQRAASAAS